MSPAKEPHADGEGVRHERQVSHQVEIEGAKVREARSSPDMFTVKRAPMAAAPEPCLFATLSRSSRFLLEDLNILPRYPWLVSQSTTFPVPAIPK